MVLKYSTSFWIKQTRAAKETANCQIQAEWNEMFQQHKAFTNSNRLGLAAVSKNTWRTLKIHWKWVIQGNCAQPCILAFQHNPISWLHGVRHWISTIEIKIRMNNNSACVSLNREERTALSTYLPLMVEPKLHAAHYHRNYNGLYIPNIPMASSCSKNNRQLL